MPISASGFPDNPLADDPDYAQNLNVEKAARLKQLRLDKIATEQKLVDTDKEITALTSQLTSNDPDLMDIREFQALPFEKQAELMLRPDFHLY